LYNAGVSQLTKLGYANPSQVAANQLYNQYKAGLNINDAFRGMPAVVKAQTPVPPTFSPVPIKTPFIATNTPRPAWTPWTPTRVPTSAPRVATATRVPPAYNPTSTPFDWKCGALGCKATSTPPPGPRQYGPTATPFL